MVRVFLTGSPFSECSNKPKLGCVVQKISKYHRIQVLYQKQFVRSLDTSVTTCFVAKKNSSHPCMSSYVELLCFQVYPAKGRWKCCFFSETLICSGPARRHEHIMITEPLIIAKITVQSLVGGVSKLFQKRIHVCKSISKC